MDNLWKDSHCFYRAGLSGNLVINGDWTVSSPPDFYGWSVSPAGPGAAGFESLYNYTGAFYYTTARLSSAGAQGQMSQVMNEFSHIP